MTAADHTVEDLLRSLAPQVLAVLVRRHGQFYACEDAVQEALLAAAVQWPEQGVPEHPRSWLVTVASRRLTDEWRSERARRDREVAVALREPGYAAVAPPADEEPPAGDDTLKLLFLCCHPALTVPAQVALTLRAVGGLSTAQIARAYLVPEATMSQRIRRAKQRIEATGARFVLPSAADRDARLGAVLHVLYLVFNEGYTASSGPDLHRAELTGEAIRLTRELRRLLPDDGEVTGLLALMLLTDAHRAARTGPGGELVPLAEQDRSRWDRAAIAEGVALVTEALTWSPPGPYQVQAAIAAVHAEAPSAAETDWRQIVALYRLLARIAPNPMVTLNQAAAVAMVDGPRAGLALLAPLDADERTAGHHRLAAVRAHLLELAGEATAARATYLAAARGTTSLPERRYLEVRAARLAADR
ncbi:MULTISPECIES: RNA polymerase sigma factor [Micromonospora]|uniref:RNA polymerase subunit sigma-24 n=1 Tax=Micromonospora sicca TaxID=2202420 RepID=A0A317DMY2_9ACTN|nr:MULTISPECIES: sigma-70 family RNA polymerase sigma factor [unclassified Micromonospora]MBM0229761.1 sigma-70 family RNA polymerase sigma factor [Micromonospora sp. ATA51]PWR16139.1 RNA polymerase subunit sigma-24 [Micromonospora sp. 4G51]